MKIKFTHKYKHVLIIKGTQGMAMLSLAVVSRLNKYQKSSVPCARLLSSFDSYLPVHNEPSADSASCARALSRLWARLNNVGHRASSISCARVLSLLGVLLLAGASFASMLQLSSDQAQAATSNTLNFQGRLLTASGARVPDGTYNVQFNLYYVSSGGSAQWTETRTNSGGSPVTVQDGYYSVYLGEVTAFPSSIDWSSDLYLGMTIRGTGSCAFGACTPTDSEMTPRFKLTAVPYALRASNVASSDTATASTDSDDVSITSGDASGATSNSGDITIDAGTATGTAGALLFGTSNASALTIGRTGVTTTIQGSVSLNGSGTALNVTNDATIGGTLGVTGLITASGGLTVTNGDTLTNAGATLNTATAISNLATGGNIGSAATTVDVATTFNVNQTTASQTLTLPSPTTTTSGRIVYVNNVGSASFTMYGSVIGTNQSNAFIWNGSSWVTTVSLSGSVVSTVGTLDSQTKSADGAVISSNAIYLQTADATYAGLVSTGSQTFAGAKTFGSTVAVTGDVTLTADLAVNGDDITSDGNLTINATGYVRVGDTGTPTTASGDDDLYVEGDLEADGTLDVLGVATLRSTLAVQGASVTVGTSSSTNGVVTLLNSTNAFGVSISASAQTVGSATISIPNTSGVADTFCLNTLNNCGYIRSSLTDNITDALDIQEGTNNYININTTNASENISFGNATTNPSFNFLGTGTLSVAGSVSIAANQSLRVIGGATGSRPSSPSEGMIFYDTTTKQLLTYANGKWQADRSDKTIIVAASNSSQTVKDRADYVADGNTGSASDGDQVQINQAITAAAGGTVYIAEGTYTIDGPITVANSTTISGAGRGTIITLPNSFSTTIDMFDDGAATDTNVVIRDLYIDGNSANQTSGTINGIGFTTAGSGSGTSSVAGLTIENVTIENMRTYGIYLSSVSHSKIHNVKIIDVTSYGIYMINGSQNTVSDSEFNAADDAIFLSATTNSIIADNSFSNQLGSGVHLASNSHYNTVTGNTGDTNGWATVYVDTSNHNVVTNNTSNANYFGIYLSTANYTTVSGNNIYNSTSDGIYVATSDYNIITNNLIRDTAGSTYAINIANPTSDSNYLADNIFLGTGASSIQDLGTSTTHANQLDASGNLVMQSGSGTIELTDNTNVTGTLTVSSTATFNGNAVVGNAVTDNLTVTAAIQGTSALIFDGSTDDTNEITLAITNPGADYTITLPAETGTICTTGSVCSGYQAAGSYLTSSLTDNTTDAFDLQEGTNNYININTTNASENISFGNAITNPSFSFLGTGTVTLAGDLAVNGDDITSDGNLTINATGYVRIGDTGTPGVASGDDDLYVESDLEVDANTDLAGTLTVGGNTTIGDAVTDNLTITAALQGTSALIFDGSTDDTNETTFSITDPTADRTVTFQDNSGVVPLGTAGNTLFFTTSGATALTLPTSGTVTVNPASGSYLMQVPTATADNTITPTANSVVGLTVNGTSGTAATAVSIVQGGAAVALNINGTSTGNVLNLQDGGTNVLTVADGGVTTITANGGSGVALTVNNGTSTGNILNIQDGGTNIATFADGGAILFKNTSNSTTGFQIQPSASTTPAFNVDTTNSRVGIGTNAPTSTLMVAGNQSTTAFSTSGMAVRISGATYTDTGTAPSGTVAFAAGTSYGIPTFAASNTGVTYTNSATLYVSDAPTAGTNVTLSNRYALYVASGNSIFGGDITTSTNLAVNGNTTIGNAVTDNLTVTAAIQGTSALLFDGSTNDTNETTLSVTNPSADRTQTIQDNSGVIPLGTAGNTLFFTTSGATSLTLPTSGTVCTTSTCLSTSLTDNTTDAFDLQEGTNNYININTTNASENISFGNAITNPSFSFLGTGTVTLAGDLAVNGDDITSDGNLTVNATGYVRIGDTGTPGVASGDDDLYVESDLEVDGRIEVTSTYTDSTAAQTLNVTLGNDANVDIISGLQVSVTSATTGDADVIHGVLVEDLVSAGATVLEYGVTIGEGWDAQLYLSDVSSKIMIDDGAVLTFADGADNTLLTVTDAGTVGNVAITGDLAVDTNTLYVDATNNKVAIGSTTTSGVGKLYVTGAVGGTNGSQVYFEGTSTDTSSVSTLYTTLGFAPSASNSSVSGASWNTATISNGNLAVAGRLAAVVGEVISTNTTGTIGHLVGGEFVASNTGAGTVSSTNGIYVRSAVNSGGGAVTTNYGGYIDYQSAGTTDYGLLIQGADTVGLLVNGGTASGVTARFNNQTSTGSILEAQDNGTNVMSIANGGAASFQNSTDSTTAFQILESSGAGGSSLLTADTTNFLLKVAPTQFTSSGSTQSFAANGSVTGVDSYSTIAVNATVAGVTVTVPAPVAGGQVVGRVLYVAAVDNSLDFVLSLAGTSVEINMKENSTATLIWNGTGWTAAGASSSTDLQAAYDNTAATAGGAEIVLASSGTGGLTIRNDATTAITGGLLEVQTSIGSNLFTVNNNATEYAANGGAESSTFTAWAAAPAGGTVTRYTTTGDNIATGAGSVFVNTTSTANTGAKNTLTASLTANLRYKVSYTARHTSSTTTFTTLETYFSNDGTTAHVECGSDATIYYNKWTRVDCTFTPTSVGASNAIIFRHTDAVEHDFYIDNFSVTVDASSNHAVDGDVNSALGTNWQAYDADGGAGTSSAVLDNTNIYNTSGAVAVTTAGPAANLGVRNNMAITPSVSTQYLVTFYAKLSSGSFTDITVGFLPAGGNSTPNANQLCTDYNTQTLSTTGWTKITCLVTTPSSGISDPDLVIYQPTSGARTFYIDALSITLNTNNSSNVQVGGGQKGGPTTLFTLDRSYGAPIADNNDAYLGSMYYDTSTGRIQCYEADGWGACGAAPDNIVNLNPEYAGAVLNGSGVGTMTADFCSNDAQLSVNSTLCDAGEAKNYYRWTSPQATQQTYSIYVTYQLPATFNGFSSDDTVQLVARTDSTTNAAVTYEMYKSTGSDVSQCGSGETTVVTVANDWQSVGINGNESTGCSFSSSSASNFIIFKINLKANSNANAYVSTLSFTTTGR